MSDYKDEHLILWIMQLVDTCAIAEAMREFAELRDEPSGYFMCGYDADGIPLCTCGHNCGEDEDCFACGEHDNLYEMEWVEPIMSVKKEQA